MKLRIPAVPIITIDPYCSIWAEDILRKDPYHWTNRGAGIRGSVFVDDKEYHFLGANSSYAPAVEMILVSTEVDACSTVFTYKNESIELTVHFTAPMLIRELDILARPVNYCKVSYKSLDGSDHNVRVKFSCSEKLVLNENCEGRAFSREVAVEGLSCIKIGKGEQKMLTRAGDVIHIDWGFFYLAVNGEGNVYNDVCNGQYVICAEAEAAPEVLFMFAYDDIKCLEYFGQQIEAYWKKDGMTMEKLLKVSLAEYESILCRCNEFSLRLQKDVMEKTGSEKYCEMLLLAFRQVLNAHKMALDPEGKLLYISKECHSGGCAATVDVTYPSAPLFLLYNTELLKAMMDPIIKFAQSESWPYDFAPHDIGCYPLLNGQFYGYFDNEHKFEYQMPVEECGNMLILFAAICDADGNTSYVEPYQDIMEQWNKYLIQYGKDPEHQLCTDDFAGRMAHNVNLSIKAIMGIAGYSRILERLGNKEKALQMMAIAKDYADHLLKTAINEDGSYALAYDKPGTFSLKYNSIWDVLWKTGLFTPEFYKGEMARYKKEMLPYGVPLDSREKYSKSDWLTWVACLTKDPKDFCDIIDPLWSAYDVMRTRVPMTDWYYCDTAGMVNFKNRTVQGGLYIRLMLD